MSKGYELGRNATYNDRSSAKNVELGRPPEPSPEEQERQQVWKMDYLDEKFFAFFGKPSAVRQTDINEIVLIYPQGEKTVRSYQLMEIGPYRDSASFSGKYEFKKTATKETVQVEFTLETNPKTTVRLDAVYLSDFPYIAPCFGKLPPEIQYEIAERIKKELATPETLAEERFKKQFPDSELSSAEKGSRIQKLRQDIIDLQAPGEMSLYQGMVTAQEEVTAGYGDARWGIGHFGDVRHTTWNLAVGIRRFERLAGMQTSRALKTFSTHQPAPGETAEQVRVQLIAEKKKEIKTELELRRKIPVSPADFNPLLYDLSGEEWLRHYTDRWDQLAQKQEALWQIEDEKAVATMKADWESYAAAAEELQQARIAAYTAAEKARKLSMDIYSLPQPDGGNIGADDLKTLRETAAAMRAYTASLEQLIESTMRERGRIVEEASKQRANAQAQGRETDEKLLAELRAAAEPVIARRNQLQKRLDGMLGNNMHQYGFTTQDKKSLEGKLAEADFHLSETDRRGRPKSIEAGSAAVLLDEITAILDSHRLQTKAEGELNRQLDEVLNGKNSKPYVLQVEGGQVVLAQRPDAFWDGAAGENTPKEITQIPSHTRAAKAEKGGISYVRNGVEYYYIFPSDGHYILGKNSDTLLRVEIDRQNNQFIPLAVFESNTGAWPGVQVPSFARQTQRKSPESDKQLRPESKPEARAEGVKLLPQLFPDNKGQWVHKTPSGDQHSGKVEGWKKLKLGDCVDIKCEYCGSKENPKLIGYVQKN